MRITSTLIIIAIAILTFQTTIAKEKKEKKNITNKIQGYISDKEYQKLTTDNSFREKYLYLLNRSPNLSTQIMHPKMLNKHTLYLYNEVIDTNMIKFMSVKDFRKLKEI